jgi:hypothetical protein
MPRTRILDHVQTEPIRSRHADERHRNELEEDEAPATADAPERPLCYTTDLHLKFSVERSIERGRKQRVEFDRGCALQALEHLDLGPNFAQLFLSRS